MNEAAMAPSPTPDATRLTAPGVRHQRQECPQQRAHVMIPTPLRVRQLANDGGLRHATGVGEWEIRIEAHRRPGAHQERSGLPGETASPGSGEGEGYGRT